MFIGLVKETTPGEHRVALTPATVRRLSDAGHRVVVEHGAGERSRYSDPEYTAAGAQIAFSATEAIHRSDLLVKVERPTPEEAALLDSRQTVLAFYHLAVAPRDELAGALTKGITAIGYEIIETAEGRLPVLEPISEIAGALSVAVAGHLLRTTSGGRGILLGGAPGVAPARVLILGAGVVGTWAARTALSNGASTCVLDNDVSKLRRLLAAVPGAVTGVADPGIIAESARRADVVIGAVLLPGERTPNLITRAMVQRMQPGSVVVDVSIDQGGCVETSRPTTLGNPVFVHDGVLHYCVPNMTADIARTASAALSQASLPYILELATRGVHNAIDARADLRRGVYTFRGSVTQPALAQRWRLPHERIEPLIARSESVS